MTMTFALRDPAQVLARALELRVDVSPGTAEVEHELGALHDRMRRPGDRLHDMPHMPSGLPGLRLRYREADGEIFVYVEDVASRQLAGYTVFNRRYAPGYVDLRYKTLTHLGEHLSAAVKDNLHTRMLLLGHGWTLGRFKEATGMY
ncbi:N-acetyltransferase [Cupriavidus pinatubonensis]|uniref:GNAT family N-acetyltransferase n=1 Tax=Cupriavidus pinatubonensis TaxID=248026 RepID=A0ABM8Y345_9BURK|nr:N-acetyltransferase [Cupriavidus pinatubonensis]CAG9187186.1 hypothetical protein LMG23994_06629 [Cupriavidus pinatubonensis]